MFDYDQGLGLGKWLKWFMGFTVIYAISTLWPDQQTVVMIGGIAAAIAIGIARQRIKEGREE